MAHRTFWKRDMVPQDVAKHRKVKAKDAALLAAYALVNQRDGNRCRCTGEPLDPHAVQAKHRREHHHLKGRNVMPEWREDPKRIVLVSTTVHRLINKGWIVVEGVDADAPHAVRFHWAEFVAKEDRIFRIKSRRRSQQKEVA